MNATQPRTAPRLIAIAAALTALHAPSWALDYVWQGGTGSWADSSKWSLLGVPGAGDSATLNSSNAVVTLSDTRSLGGLILSKGYLGGSGQLNTGSASFANAVLGLSGTSGGVLNISGNTLFNGSTGQHLRHAQTVNLNGNSTWSAGNGRIEVDAGFAGNNATNPYAASQFNIAVGTTFTDAGAAAAAGSKQIGYSGGQVNNAGTYVRNGLGTTVALGLNNMGLLK